MTSTLLAIDINIPEVVTNELGKILPLGTPPKVSKAYAELIQSRLKKGLSGADTFRFLREVVPPAGQSVLAGGDHPWNFLSMLVKNSGECPDWAAKLNI